MMNLTARRAKHGGVDGRNMRRVGHLAALEEFLRERPRTVVECAELLGLKNRAVYLLLDALQASGIAVIKEGRRDGGYRIQ